MQIRLLTDETLSSGLVRAGVPITITGANADECFALVQMHRAFLQNEDSVAAASGDLGPAYASFVARQPVGGLSLSSAAPVAGNLGAGVLLARVATPQGGTIALVDNGGGRVSLTGKSLLSTSTAFVAGVPVNIILSLDGVPRSITLYPASRAGVASGPTFGALSLAAPVVAENTAQGTTISGFVGQTSGSAISLTNTAGGRFALSAGVLVAGATNIDYDTATGGATSYQITARETKVGYTDRDTVLAVNVSNVLEGATLNALSLSSLAFTIGTAANGAITGATVGEAISPAGFPTGLTINGPARTWAYDGTGSAGTSTPSLTGSLADSPNSPRVSNLSVTIAAAGASLDGYDIYLLAGQSNMAGRGTRNVSLDVDDAKVDQFGGLSTLTASYQKIVAGMLPALQHPDTQTYATSYFGPGEYIARTLSPSLGANRKILLVPVSYGGRGLVAGNPLWAPGNPGASLYEAAISQANLAITAAIAAGANSSIKGIFWHQGESDGQAGTVTTAAYLSAMNTLIAGFRSRITGAVNAPFIIGQLMPEQVIVDANYRGIDVAHRQAVLANPNMAFVEGPVGSIYVPHYNEAGIRVLGTRMAAGLARAIARSEVTYSFNEDTLGTNTPMAITNESTAGDVPIIASGSLPNLSGNYLTLAGTGNIAATNHASITFDAVAAAQTDCVVEWTEGFTGTANATWMKLRAQPGPGDVTNGRDGYLVMHRSSVQDFRLFKCSGGVLTAIGATVTAFNKVSGRRFRFAAIGSGPVTLSAAYSDNGGTTWTDIFAPRTDSASPFTSGTAEFLFFTGHARGTTGLDNVAFRKAI